MRDPAQAETERKEVSAGHGNKCQHSAGRYGTVAASGVQEPKMAPRLLLPRRRKFASNGRRCSSGELPLSAGPSGEPTHFGTWLQCLFRSTYHMPERNQRTAWHAPPGLGRDVWDSRAGHDESDALRGVVWRWYALSNGCLAFETEAARTFCSLCWCTCVCISKREQQCQHRTFVSVAAPKYLVPKDVHVHLHRKEKNRLPGNTTSNFSK